MTAQTSGKSSLFVVSAPSGAGKSSLIAALRGRDPSFFLSISHTTRNIRPGETDGLNYHFVSKERFEEMIAHGDFLEYAIVHGNYYGTSKTAVFDQLNAGHDVMLEIDTQGAEQIRALYPQAVCIFILPPSNEALRERLTRRATDAPDVIEKRLKEAANEMAQCTKADFVIVNRDFDRAVDDLHAVVRAGRLRTANQASKENSLFESLGAI